MYVRMYVYQQCYMLLEMVGEEAYTDAIYNLSWVPCGAEVYQVTMV